MSREHFEQMLDYYQQEMIYLRRAGARFVEKYPKIAQNLNLSSAGSADPHVQRLIESFAFLTGRLQKQIDNQYLEFTNTLLGVLYPQFVDPFPSASVSSFRLSPNLGKTTSGYTVPRGTPLFTEAQEGKVCRFQTTYPVELWPFEVAEASLMNVDETPLPPHRIKSQWTLKLRIRRYDGVMNELNPAFLRFYISGDTLTTQCLYESILAYDPKDPTPVYLMADNGEAPVELPAGSLKQVGFQPEEAMIPYPHKALDAYRLLFEYFVFPNKFKFIDVTNFSTLGAQEHVDIYIPIADSSQADRLRINNSNFMLGCTPIINLFPKISEPLDLNYQAVSYPLVGDQRNQDTTEIHSILKVMATVDGGKNTEEFAPYFSYDYDIEAKDKGLFWHSTRAPSEVPGATGTDVFLSFVDYKFSPQNPTNKAVYAQTLCSNRDLATFVPTGGALQVDGAIPPCTIKCVERPTPPLTPSLQGESLWKLVSQLSLNHLSLSGDKKAILALKELLQLYSGLNKNKSHPEITALDSISYRPVMQRKGRDAWRGFIQGLSINLTLDETPFSGQGGFMLATVLNEFFSLYVALNSFTELTLTSTQTDGIWKKWPGQVGSQNLL